MAGTAVPIQTATTETMPLCSVFLRQCFILEPEDHTHVVHRYMHSPSLHHSLEPSAQALQRLLDDGPHKKTTKSRTGKNMSVSGQRNGIRESWRSGGHKILYPKRRCKRYRGELPKKRRKFIANTVVWPK